LYYSDQAVNFPLLLIGHGTRDSEGRQTFLDFAAAFQGIDSSRPVIPCFLELTEPSIEASVDRCVEQGYQEMTVLPVLLFAARHNKFDVTNELDRARRRHPNLTLHYGRHLGLSPQLLDLWRQRLAHADAISPIPREETVLLFVGRGSSDPDANADVYKMARLLWEGSGFKGVEVCFSGITHPRLEPGFERAWTWQPQRLVVIPHFLFTGVLVKRIQAITHQQQAEHPQVAIQLCDEIGLDPVLLALLQEREQEARMGQVMMNCDLCKFRRAVTEQLLTQPHGQISHHHSHHQDAVDPYAHPHNYHQKVWQVP